MKKKRKRGTGKPRRGVHIGDITREIAIAKAMSRAHGPFMQTCTACGERYWPNEKEGHLASAQIGSRTSVRVTKVGAAEGSG
jgi:hypothetical protein